MTDPDAVWTNSPSPNATGEVEEDSFDIAVTGLAIRCPGAPDAAAFWDNLSRGVESITHTGRPAGTSDGPRGRWVPARGVLADAERFDAAFFGYSARDAALTDPQQRQLVEAAWEAFEDAATIPGIEPAAGVFAGAGFPTYLLRRIGLSAAADIGDYPLVIGNDKDHIATRIAYLLNLRGPAMTVQTACSTSLVCLHAACQSLLSGECDLAVAGAAAVSFPQDLGYEYVEDGILSPDGHCRPFDAAGQGTVPSSGVVAVVLRRLTDACRRGDPVRAVIRATAVNNDGNGKLSYTSPSVSGQARAITDALRLAALSPNDISYVEAHGTATPLGDTVELAALDRALPGDSMQTCRIGSVKSNIGHLDVAAGLAGLVKTVLALQHEMIPPTLHFERPNPDLGLENTRFRIADREELWLRTDRPRRAGVSSFGLGGTNAHAIVEEAPAPPPSPDAAGIRPLLLSAGSTGALDEYTNRLAGHLQALPADRLHGVAATLAFGRRHRIHRRAIVADTLADAIARTTGAGPATVAGSPRIAFVFPGAATISGAALRELLAFTKFAEGYELARVACAEAGGVVLDAADVGDVDPTELHRPTVGLPVLFATELGLAELWTAWGVRPDVVLGHSSGEYAAAVLAEVMDLSAAAALVVRRAQLLEEAPEGSMVALRVGVAEAKRLAAEHGLSVAVLNTPNDVVLSGAAPHIQKLLEYVETAGIDAHAVPVATAAHSALLGDAASRLTAFADTVALREPSVAFVSSATGQVESDVLATAGYWGRHLRDTVQFADAVATTVPLASVLLEVGPGGGLTSILRNCPGVEDDQVVSTLPHPRDPKPLRRNLAEAAARLWERGAEISWDDLIDRSTPRLNLPAARFTGELHTIDVAGVSDRSEDIDGSWVYERVWSPRSEVTRPDTASLGGSRWVVFDDGSSLASEVGAGLRTAGATVRRVRPTDCPDLPAGATDLDGPARAWLAEVLAGRTGVCYFWASAAESDRRPAFTFDLPMAIAAVLGEEPAPATFVAVGRGLYPVLGTEPADPDANLVTGPVLVASREYPHISALLLDADPAGDRTETVDLVLAAVAAPDDEVVAIRGRRAWLPDWRRVPVPEAEPEFDGTVLITGGLGGVGLAVATAFAEAGAERIALLGRTGLPPQSEWDAATGRTADVVGAIRRIEALGTRMVVAEADVSSTHDLTAALDMIAARLGPVHSVVHAAGIAGGGLIALRTAAECAALMSPKVAGIRALATCLAGHPVRRVQICSALDAILGTFGQVDHVAANAFLDAVPRTGWFGQAEVQCVTWGMWRDVGQAAAASDLTDRAAWRRQLLDGAIDPASGGRLARRLLAVPVPNVAVSAHHIGRLLAQVRTHRPDTLLERDPQPVSGRTRTRSLPSDSYVEPEGPIAKFLATQWSHVLGVSPIGATDNYFALGGHSLAAIELVSRLREVFPFPIRLTDLLTHATVRDQAQWLVERIEHHVETVPDDELESQIEALDRVLSPAETGERAV